jgi:hypothetical protein
VEGYSYYLAKFDALAIKQNGNVKTKNLGNTIKDAHPNDFEIPKNTIYIIHGGCGKN